MKKNKTPLLPVLIGTGFGAGFWPWGPGTAGALLATIVWYAVALFVPAGAPLVAVTLTLALVFQCLGIWAADKLEPYWGEDPKQVVVDEMVGVWIALLAVSSANLPYAIAAFVLFRFFDIVKPFGIRHMENMGGGVGMMMDDVLAGMYSFFVLYIIRQVFTL